MYCSSFLSLIFFFFFSFLSFCLFNNSISNLLYLTRQMRSSTMQFFAEKKTPFAPLQNTLLNQSINHVSLRLHSRRSHRFHSLRRRAFFFACHRLGRLHRSFVGRSVVIVGAASCHQSDSLRRQRQSRVVWRRRHSTTVCGIGQCAARV